MGDQMKKLLLGLVMIASVQAQAEWKDILGDFQTGTGTQIVVPLPAELAYRYPYGYVASSPFTTEFIVRIGPKSLERGCTLATNNTGDQIATGVMSSQPRLRPTTFAREEWSQKLQGWKNFYFNVNGGQGAPVQAITVAFKRGFERATQCYFQLAYSSGADSHLRAVAPFEAPATEGVARALAAPAAAPQAAPAAEAQVLKNTNEKLLFPLETTHQ